ncbi:MAG TPA: vanadium-dependent haloperoxidase [Chitinophagaceae bacterium]|nr:vanadium-dependent haloperoxidase [Chitinophagaceae bacterium]
MKPQIKLSISNALLLLTFLSIVTMSCQKETKQTLPNEEIATAPNNNKEHGHLKQTKEFSSDVVIQWLNLDLDLVRTPLPAGTTVQGGERILAYSGIALYEAVVNGMPAYQSLSGQLTDFPTMPSTESGKAYHWAAAANAALAEITRYLFDTASTSANPQVKQQRLDKINGKENQLQAVYATEADASVINRSIYFGKQVAKKVNDWADTDGWKLQNNAYTPPPPTALQPWLWVPTAPPPAAPINPHMEFRRLLVHHSDNGATIAPFPTFSTIPGSEFYEMANDVYIKSQSPTAEQKHLALYFRDSNDPGFPGYYGGSGHYIAMLPQVISQSGVALDMAALAFAKSGIAVNDAAVVGFRTKYIFNLLRPITYIRNFTGHATWSPLFATPNHPEFPSAHSFHAGGFLTGLADLFGDDFEFTDNTYNNMSTSLGTLHALTFHSFTEVKKAVGDSRVYGGIHYGPSCTKGIQLGEKVARNVLNTLKFLKE